MIANEKKMRKESEKFKKTSNRNFCAIFAVDLFVDTNNKLSLLEANTFVGFSLTSRIAKRMHHLIWAQAHNLIGFVPYDSINGKPLDNKPINNDIDEAIAELGRPRGNFELIFPLKENLDYYRKFFL